ncbi:hypothetical protein A6M21_03355 [Desulfotomaculum copahuensis]|uniref:ABC transmembrane type-1 domain-containing protein n=1 Tax=Desulfotomaculum copahuensis TaxID=1838280 RepID=A0A1B7LIR8_9FIRM|nr:hypothetical protein A6M21_03355 [Desulfotomaculum copahuensis]
MDKNIENAARILGAGEWRVFWTISLPLARPGLVAKLVMAFARALGGVRRHPDAGREHPRPHPDRTTGHLRRRRGEGQPHRPGAGGHDDVVEIYLYFLGKPVERVQIARGDGDG